MEAVNRQDDTNYTGVISDLYISDVHDGRFLTGSYTAHWFQPVGIPEIYGARNLGLDPNNIEYYLISEQERQRRLERERRWSFSTPSLGSEDTISFQSVMTDDIRVGDTLRFVGIPEIPDE